MFKATEMQRCVSRLLMAAVCVLAGDHDPQRQNSHYLVDHMHLHADDLGAAELEAACITQWQQLW